MFVKQIFKNYSKKTDYDKYHLTYIKVDDIIKWACLVFGIIVLIFDVKYILRVTGFGIRSLSRAIKEYDVIYKFSGRMISPPRLLGISLIILQDMA